MDILVPKVPNMQQDTTQAIVQVNNDNIIATTPTQQGTVMEDATVEPITLQTPPPTQVNQQPTVATGSPTPVVTAHAQELFSDRNGLLRDVNGTVSRRQWIMRTVVGDHLTNGHNVDKSLSRLDVFLLIFPPDHLLNIVNLTNRQLQKADEKITSVGEMVTIFGVILLITRFEFNSRADLWSKKPLSKYIPSPDFGRTGMNRKMFDTLWRYIRWANQPDQRPDDMSSEQYRWLVVDGFVNSFNNHRASTFSPSESI
jgi:Transposase IS4